MYSDYEAVYVLIDVIGKEKSDGSNVATFLFPPSSGQSIQLCFLLFKYFVCFKFFLLFIFVNQQPQGQSPTILLLVIVVRYINISTCHKYQHVPWLVGT